MKIYDFLTNKNNLNIIVKLIKNDIKADIILITHLAIYQKFHEIKGSKTLRYNQLAIENKVHPKTIQKIIIKLNKNVK